MTILANKIYDIIQCYEDRLSDGFEYYGGDEAVKELADEIVDMIFTDYMPMYS